MRGSVRGRILLAVGGSLVGLGLAELAVGIFCADEVASERIAERNARTSFGAFTRPSEIPGLVYELAPGTRLSWNRLPLLAVSDRGSYRVDEAGERPVPAGALRVAVLGDSTSFGWQVPYAASYPELVRSMLAELLERPVALRNWSVPGYDTEQEEILLGARVLGWEPDLLLLHYDHNDWEPPIREKPASYLDPSFGDNVLGSALVKLLRRRHRIAREVERRDQLSLGGHLRSPEGYAYRGPLYDRHLGALRRIADVADAREIPVLLVLFDAQLRRASAPLESPHYLLLHRDLVAALVEEGFHVLELFHPYQRLMEAEGWDDLSPLWLSAADAHPNEAGHRLIAQAIAKFVASSSALRARLASTR